jgi:hypothetical protein
LSRIISSNNYLRTRAESDRAYLNVSSWLRLFQNDFIPSPSSQFLDFIESTFPGYAPLGLVDAFGAPLKLSDGSFYLPCAPQEFTPTNNATEKAYGFFLTVAGEVVMSGRFGVPAPIINGIAVGVNLVVLVQEPVVP